MAYPPTGPRIPWDGVLPPLIDPIRDDGNEDRVTLVVRRDGCSLTQGDRDMVFIRRVVSPGHPGPVSVLPKC